MFLYWAVGVFFLILRRSGSVNGEMTDDGANIEIAMFMFTFKTYDVSVMVWFVLLKVMSALKQYHKKDTINFSSVV